MTPPIQLQIQRFPFERTTSFLQGTRAAPAAICQALRLPSGVPTEVKQICDPFEVDPDRVTEKGFDATTNALRSGGFPLSIGGEHTVSVGPIRAARAAGNVGIVQLDAHADLRDSYQGSKWSHASAMRRSVEDGTPLLGIGVRAMCEEEAAYVKSRDDITLVEGRDAAFSVDWYEHLVDLPERIYLTIDLDVLDPVELPDVGTPEPGGMGFETVWRFLTHLFRVKNVVAADVVELCPGVDSTASIEWTARLIEHMVSLRFGRVFESDRRI